MQCQSCTKEEKQCSRITKNNSTFCWQHQKLSQQALQSGILGNIELYAGLNKPITKTSLAYSKKDKLKILENWFSEINIKTPFSEISENDVHLLWNLYIQRINNVPRADLLEKAITQGLNKYLFYSKYFNYKGIIPDLPERMSDLYLYDATLNDDPGLLNFIKENKVREGDLIYLEQYYYGEGFPYNILYYTGSELEFFPGDSRYDLFYPEDVYINNFPIPEYFEKTINTLLSGDNVDLIYFNTEGYILQLVEVYQTGLDEFPILYQYQAIKDSNTYIIYSIRPTFVVDYKEIITLSYNNLITAYIKLDDLFEKIVNKNNPRVLYDIQWE